MKYLSILTAYDGHFVSSGRNFFGSDYSPTESISNAVRTSITFMTGNYDGNVEDDVMSIVANGLDFDPSQSKHTLLQINVAPSHTSAARQQRCEKSPAINQQNQGRERGHALARARARATNRAWCRRGGTLSVTLHWRTPNGRITQ